MKKGVQLTCCLFMTLLSWSCQSTSSVTPPATDDYFPLITSRYSIYDVTEKRYSLNAVPVLLSYQLKEVTGQGYTDVTNQTAYRVTRYRRSAESQPWKLDSVWSARQTGTEAIRTESGRDIVKLMLPVADNARWNANRLNNAGADEYELRNVGQPFDVSGIKFDRTATVLQQADSTLVGQDKRREVYAQAVGLIYKEFIQVQFCTVSPGCIGKNQVDYGIQQTFRIRSYGIE